MARTEYNVNPRFVPDDIPVWFGNDKDAAVVYDATAKEWTVQTTDAAGALVDRLAVGGESNTPAIVVNDPGNDVDLRVEASGQAYALFLEGSSGNLLLGRNTALSPDTLLHVWAGSAGVVAATANTILTVENSTAAYVSVLVPNAVGGGLVVGTPSNAFRGYLIYDGGANRWACGVEGADRWYMTTAALQFQQATTIVTTAGNLTLNPAGDVSLSNNNLVQGTAYHELGEIADPAAPAADNARLYAKDNGSGKTQLVVRFPTGAVQVLATEP